MVTSLVVQQLAARGQHQPPLDLIRTAELALQEGGGGGSSFVFPLMDLSSVNVDKETNTECVFIQQPVLGRKMSRDGDSSSSSSSRLGHGGGSSIVKRSKTFSPSAPINKSQYNCRVSRDSGIMD